MQSSGELSNGTSSIPKFKLILVGDVGVGKTSLFLRIRDSNFHEGAPPTAGIDSCTRRVKIDGKEIQMSLWDTAGVERFRTLTRNFYRNTHAVLMVFSVDDPDSLSSLSKWQEDAKEYAPTALRFLVGNKIDKGQLVTQTTVESFATFHECESAFLTSAKTGQGIPDVLSRVTEKLLTSYKTTKYDLENSWLHQSVHVNQGDLSINSSKSTCC